MDDRRQLLSGKRILAAGVWGVAEPIIPRDRSSTKDRLVVCIELVSNEPLTFFPTESPSQITVASQLAQRCTGLNECM